MPKLSGQLHQGHWCGLVWTARAPPEREAVLCGMTTGCRTASSAWGKPDRLRTQFAAGSNAREYPFKYPHTKAIQMV